MTRRQRYDRITRALAEPGNDTARLIAQATAIEEAGSIDVSEPFEAELQDLEGDEEPDYSYGS